jgi:hypothetical protein
LGRSTLNRRIFGPNVGYRAFYPDEVGLTTRSPDLPQGSSELMRLTEFYVAWRMTARVPSEHGLPFRRGTLRRHPLGRCNALCP